jgi:hypothetical protein
LVLSLKKETLKEFLVLKNQYISEAQKKKDNKRKKN